MSIIGYLPGLGALTRAVEHAPAGSSKGGQFVSHGGGGGSPTKEHHTGHQAEHESKGDHTAHKAEHAEHKAKAEHAEHHNVWGEKLSKEPHPVLSSYFGKPTSEHDLAESLSGGSHAKVRLSSFRKDPFSGKLRVEAVVHEHGFEPSTPLKDHPKALELGFKSQREFHEAQKNHPYNHPGTPLDESKKVGRIVRTYERQDDGKLHVDHGWLSVPEHMRGKGAGKEILRNSQTFYDKAGVDRIHLQAGDSHGRYVWARMGFEASAKSTKAYKDAFAKHLTESGHDAKAVSKLKSMQDIANFKTPDGHRAGKEFLLAMGDGITKKDGSWQGTSPIKLWEGRINRGTPGWDNYAKHIQGSGD